MGMYLYGRHSVYERLKADPGSVEEVYLDKNFDDPAILNLLGKNKISVSAVAKQKILKIQPQANIQGIAARVSEFRYREFDDLLNEGGRSKLSFIFLDRVFDPQNLGAMIRTAACFGRFAIVIPKHKACGVNETVLRVACGGENFVPLARVVNMRNSLFDAKDCGYWACGAAIDEGEDLGRARLPFPLCLVLGSEGKGLRYGLKKHLDKNLLIPMPGAALSFNVTAACAVFCYEIARQRPA
jgi:23S rRNA (guanosine2251-2'-O)-methyltransferase